jgi:hypothetical protein
MSKVVKRRHLWTSSEMYMHLATYSFPRCMCSRVWLGCYWGAACMNTLFELVNWKTYFNIAKKISMTRLYMHLCQETEISSVLFCDQCMAFNKWMWWIVLPEMAFVISENIELMANDSTKTHQVIIDSIVLFTYFSALPLYWSINFLKLNDFSEFIRT